MIYILLPAYNEEKDLPPLLKRVKAALAGQEYQVLVVNDGSQDQTLSIARAWAEQMPLTVLDHGVNKGLGQAMLTGLSHAVEVAGPDDLVVAMDADNTHDPALTLRMAQQIFAGKDVVIASRYAPGGEEIGLTPIRRLLSRGASFLLRLFFPIQGALDYTCGYRAYRVEFLRRAFCCMGRMS